MRRLGLVAFFSFVAAFAVPASAAWHQARTRHFLIYADQTPAELQRYAARLERFDQAVRQVRRMNDPPLSDSSRLTIYVLKDEYAIGKLAGGYGVAGFYIQRASGSVAFVPKKSGSKYDKWDLDAEPVFFHEYAHHLQLQYADVGLPAWVTEGFAEFFATAQVRDDGSVVIGAPPTYRAVVLLNFNDLSIQELLRGDTDLTDIESDLVYGRGWLLTHYLAFSPERRGQFDRYVADVQKGVPLLTAAKAAFGDLNDLSRQISRYVERKKLPHLVLSGKRLNPGPIQIRSLSAAEDAMLDVAIRSARGATKKTAPRIAADARHEAARFPSDTFAQTALARAEFDAGNYEAAEDAADRALAADPNRLAALIIKGRARMELARKAPAKADWDEIRRWFLKANKADPEAAEPLMRFYQTYVYSGEHPTRNAVDGLLYAHVLAPRDDLLRLAVVRQMVFDGRPDEARRYFAPFAFEPHGRRDRRNAARETMEALTAKNTAEALSHLTKLQQLLEDEE